MKVKKKFIVQSTGDQIWMLKCVFFIIEKKVLSKTVILADVKSYPSSPAVTVCKQVLRICREDIHG